MNSCNTNNRTARIPRNAAGQYHGKRRWQQLTCILFLAVSFGIGAMLLVRSDEQTVFRLEEEAFQAGTKFTGGAQTAAHLVEYDWEEIPGAVGD